MPQRRRRLYELVGVRHGHTEGESSICEHNHRNPIEEPKQDKLSLMWGEYKEGKVSYI